MIILQKLWILYKKEGISKDFLRGACTGAAQILKRTYTQLFQRLDGIPSSWDLRTNGVYRHNPNASGGDKVLYLTFDTEWVKPENVDHILDTLKEKQVPATFFITGERMKENAPFVQRIRVEGHTVGNHTMNHPILPRCTPEEISKELNQCAECYHTLTGEVMPKLMRPPYGEVDIRTIKYLHNLGYQSCLWNMHVFDWKKDEPATWDVFKSYLDTDLKNGAIILQHSFSDETTAHIGKYIDYCHSKGYRFGNLREFISF